MPSTNQVLVMFKASNKFRTTHCLYIIRPSKNISHFTQLLILLFSTLPTTQGTNKGWCLDVMGPSFEEVSYCQTMTMTTMVGKPNYKTQSHNPDNGLSIFQVHCGGGCEREQWGVNGQFYYCQPSPASSTSSLARHFLLWSQYFLFPLCASGRFFLEILILLQFVLGITTFMLVYLSEVLRKESPILLGIRWWYHLASACHGVSYAEPYKHCHVNSFSSIVKQYSSGEDSTGYPQLDAQSHISGCWPFFLFFIILRTFKQLAVKCIENRERHS